MKRWPVIRHVCYFWHSYWFWKWFNQFQRMTGGQFGLFPNEVDLDYLQGIWEGKH